MKKIIYRIFISLIFILFSLVFYLSIIGIKTDKFNAQITSQINNIEPNLKLKINEVSAKLNLFSFAIDAKTIGTNLIYRNKIIKLENIKSKISLKSIIANQFALTKISISTKSIPIKDLISFIRQLNKEPKLLIAEHIIENGFITADIELDFDEFGKIRNNYNVKGLVNDGQISLFNKKISKLNFIFQITNKELKFDDIKLLLNNKNILISKLLAIKQDKEFLVSCKISNQNLKLRENEIKNFIDNELIKTNLKEIIFSSDNELNFKIDQNFKFKNFDIKSNIDLEFLRLDNFLNIKKNFPNIKDEIILKNQKIKLEYKKDLFNILGSGDIILQKEIDVFQYKIEKNKKELNFDTKLSITKNPFVIDLLGYVKNEKSTLDLSLKGKLFKDNLLFKEVLISENKNILDIKDLKFSQNYQIEDIGNIKIKYTDKENLKNQVQVLKDKKSYRITGNSFNLSRIITKLIDSDDNKTELFNKNFKLTFDVKKVYLDKSNITNNLKGFLLLNDNEISEANLVAEFQKKKKIKFTIKTSDNNEKITTLFSSNAKPLVNRYKFIKGFNEGSLDFYSIKKSNETNSTLKIYDFKLKELPALTKVLTLASLQGIADLLSGEGIRFSEFEMNFTNNSNLMKINEVYATGPAISILMEGYIEKKKLISLKGTLVPATTINKTIGSIPILGDILVGKKTGEGVFGVSFKIKGPPDDLETTVNPIKTLTPRFITRILEKFKEN
ncbi:hypothetical protein OA382_00115 [Candidatus Pelagibacter sp.]|nr:hypothetical protein [Candidatus Pelagibacter sp.]MDC3135558.1 hypothetical protein [Candidatus Pelagibacter sp.]